MNLISLEHPAYMLDTSDEEWALSASYLALLRADLAQSGHDLREVFNGLHYIVKTGATWQFTMAVGYVLRRSSQVLRRKTRQCAQRACEVVLVSQAKLHLLQGNVVPFAKGTSRADQAGSGGPDPADGPLPSRSSSVRPSNGSPWRPPTPKRTAARRREVAPAASATRSRKSWLQGRPVPRPSSGAVSESARLHGESPAAASAKIENARAMRANRLAPQINPNFLNRYLYRYVHKLTANG